MTLIVMLRSCHSVITTSSPADDDTQAHSISITDNRETIVDTYSSCCWNTGSVGGPLNDFSPHLKMD